MSLENTSVIIPQQQRVLCRSAKIGGGGSLGGLSPLENHSKLNPLKNRELYFVSKINFNYKNV